MTATVHWRVARTDDVPNGDTWLTAAECVAVSPTARPKRRRQWRLGRWNTKRLLAEVCGWQQVEILRADDGAPITRRDASGPAVAISISHRDDLGLSCVAPAGTKLGCDLERIEPRRGVFVADYFTAAERDAVAHTDAARRDAAVTAIWSAKESALKALRTGLRRDTRSIEVLVDDIPEAGEWIPISITDVSTGARLSCWWTTMKDGRARYAITIAADTVFAPTPTGATSSKGTSS